LWQPSRTQLHTHLAGAASDQPHAHTTSNPKHLQAQAMLAAPRSPGLAPASCGASPTARYSPPRLTCCRCSALSGSLLAVLQPPPHLFRQVAVLQPRLTRRLPTPRAPRRSPRSRSHASLQQGGTRTSTQLKSAKHTRALQSGVVRGERGTGQSKCAEEAARAFISNLLSDPCDHDGGVASVVSRMLRRQPEARAP